MLLLSVIFMLVSLKCKENSQTWYKYKISQQYIKSIYYNFNVITFNLEKNWKRLNLSELFFCLKKLEQ